MSPYLYGDRNRRGDGRSSPPNDNPENGGGQSNTPLFEPQRLNLQRRDTPLNGEPGRVNGDALLNGHPFDATFLNGETGRVNGEHQVHRDADVRWVRHLTSEHPSSFIIDRANRSVLIRIHDVQGPELYSRTLSNSDTLPNERFTIFDSDRSVTSVIEYYGANNANFPQLHQMIYRGDIDIIMRNYDQAMNGNLNNENREQELHRYLLEHRVYTISTDRLHVTSSSPFGNAREYVYRLDG